MTIQQDLAGRVAVVTGGSRGIGHHIAGALHRAGATVGITGRREDTLSEAAREIGDRCHAFPCDHRDAGAVAQLSRTVMKGIGAPDILVNNAGVYRSAPVDSMPIELWSEVLDTNLTGVFLTTQAFLPGMLAANRGDIFMISSMSGKKGDPGSSAYAASKFGLQGFSQALTHEVRRSNIRVMVLNPSSVDTRSDRSRKEGPGLHLHAEDIADTIVHLACLPGRTLIRDMELWGTNPFRS